MSSLRIIRGLQAKGIFLLGCEVSPFFVLVGMAFFAKEISYSQSIALVNCEDPSDIIKVTLPVIKVSPIYNLKIERNL